MGDQRLNLPEAFVDAARLFWAATDQRGFIQWEQSFYADKLLLRRAEFEVMNTQLQWLQFCYDVVTIGCPKPVFIRLPGFLDPGSLVPSSLLLLHQVSKRI